MKQLHPGHCSYLALFDSHTQHRLLWDLALVRTDSGLPDMKRKDSGMSGMTANQQMPETAAPKTRDFAKLTPINTNDSRNNARYDYYKYDTKGASTRTGMAHSQSPPRSVLEETRHKENVSMLRRMKNMALAPLQIGGGKA